MKLLSITFVLLCFCLCLYGQKSTSVECNLQELAINAALGKPEAQYDLGVEFYTGVNVGQDFSKAAVMWRLASQNGSFTGAFNNLGYLTYYGKGVKQDFPEGIRLWRIAAENGYPESQIHLATAYSDGKHLKIDYVEAYAWAATGKHFAEQMKDTEIIKMAERRLVELRKKISNLQLTQGEKKAKEYFAKFAPKENQVQYAPNRP
jgi:TPR repeat protein